MKETKTTRRYMGIDLHPDSFLVCIREAGPSQWQRWSGEQIEQFASTLRPTDAIAVEATGNTR